MLRIRPRHIALPLSTILLLGCGSEDPTGRSVVGDVPGGGGQVSSGGAPTGGSGGEPWTSGGTAGQATAGTGGSSGGAAGQPATGGAGGTTGGGAGVGGVAGSDGGTAGSTGGIAGVGGNPLCEVVFYRDADGDGHGQAGSSIVDCAAPAGYVTSSDDCNDGDPNNWASCATCRDQDTDGHFIGCDVYVTLKGADCDDTRPWINGDMPDAPPLRPGDTEDWNCDGSDVAVDETVGVFVSPRGDDSNPGTRDEPVLTLKRGVELAEAGQLQGVFIAGGYYQEEITTSVSLFGGFDPDTWQRNPLLYVTSIVAPSERALSIASGAHVALQGFELSGTSSPNQPSPGAGSVSSPLRAQDATFIVHSVRISGGDNPTLGGEIAGIDTERSNVFVVKSDVFGGAAKAGTFGLRATGGWAYLEATSVTLSQSTLAATRSAGLALFDARGTVWKSSVMGGRALSSFGILADPAKSLRVLDSTVHGGSSLPHWTGADAPHGCVAIRFKGATANIQSSVLTSGESWADCFSSRALDSDGFVTLVDTLLDAGTAPVGAAMTQRSGQSVIVGSTLIANQGVEGQAWDLSPGSLGVAVNSIFSFHTDTGIRAGGTLQSFFNDIWSPSSDCLVEDAASTCTKTAQEVNAHYCLLPSCGNQSADPQFDANGQISASSPCVNAGIDPSPWFSGPSFDLNGQLRPLGGSYDQGAFEVN